MQQLALDFFCSIRKAGSDHCAQDKVPAIVWEKVGGKAACSSIDSQSRMKKCRDEKSGNENLWMKNWGIKF